MEGELSQLDAYAFKLINAEAYLSAFTARKVRTDGRALLQEKPTLVRIGKPDNRHS